MCLPSARSWVISITHSRRASSRPRRSMRSLATSSLGASPAAPTRTKLPFSIPQAWPYRTPPVRRASTSGRSPRTSAHLFQSALSAFTRGSFMLECFTSQQGNAIPITTVREADLPRWLDAHPESREWVGAVGFKAEAGTFVLLAGNGGRPSGALVSPAEGAPVWALSSLPTALPEGAYSLASEDGDLPHTDTALGWALGSYAFTRYKKAKRLPATLVWPTKADRAEVERIAQGVFLARDMINTPAEDMGPEHLADAVLTVAKSYGAQTQVIVGDDLLQQNYPTIHIVGRASSRAPRLIDLRWGDEAAPKVTLVGKGVCFDTGGLDLKSHEGMLEMKKDMGGAAVMLGLASALMSANTPIRLRLLIPAVENSVAGNAYRPLDIVRTRSGKTVEIGNTDAEGRLVLCDALAEAD